MWCPNMTHACGFLIDKYLRDSRSTTSWILIHAWLSVTVVRPPSVVRPLGLTRCFDMHVVCAGLTPEFDASG
jgi:hypothetical protein